MREPIYVERHGAIATVVLNRPEKHNAINVVMFRRLREIMDACDHDDTLRCVVEQLITQRSLVQIQPAL
jgi:enoyl-CoA hydratase